MLQPLNLRVPRDPSHALLSLVDTCDSLEALFYAGARRTLQSLLADPNLLEGLDAPDSNEWSRTLLWRDPLNRFGIWALWWPPGSQTPIHNHHCSCAFGVYRGRIEEILYVARDPVAVEQERCMRTEGYVGGGTNGGEIVHRMRNPDDRLAVSLHLYAYHPEHHDSSIDRRFGEATVPGADAGPPHRAAVTPTGQYHDEP